MRETGSEGHYTIYSVNH